jgi:hypothetical protein
LAPVDAAHPDYYEGGSMRGWTELLRNDELREMASDANQVRGMYAGLRVKPRPFSVTMLIGLLILLCISVRGSQTC